MDRSREQSDPTLLSAVSTKYHNYVHGLLEGKYSSQISREAIARFRLKYQSTAYICRYPDCPRKSSGFNSSEARSDHESLRHGKGIKCSEPACLRNQAGYTDSNALKRHFQNKHRPVEVVYRFKRIKTHNSSDSRHSTAEIAPRFEQGKDQSDFQSSEAEIVMDNKALNLTDNDLEGRNDLTRACIGNASMTVLLLLVQNFTIIDQLDSRGEAPLHVASIVGNVNIVEILLEIRCSIDLVSQVGNTALFEAVANDHLDIARMLLAKGADADIENPTGYRPVDLLDTDRPDGVATLAMLEAASQSKIGRSKEVTLPLDRAQMLTIASRFWSHLNRLNHTEGISAKGGSYTTANVAQALHKIETLSMYQLQLILLENKNKDRLLKARQEQDANITSKKNQRRTLDAYSMQLAQNYRRNLGTSLNPERQRATHPLQDYQMQLILLEQQKAKERCLTQEKHDSNAKAGSCTSKISSDRAKQLNHSNAIQDFGQETSRSDPHNPCKPCKSSNPTQPTAEAMGFDFSSELNPVDVLEQLDFDAFLENGDGAELNINDLASYGNFDGLDFEEAFTTKLPPHQVAPMQQPNPIEVQVKPSAASKSPSLVSTAHDMPWNELMPE